MLLVVSSRKLKNGAAYVRFGVLCHRKKNSLPLAQADAAGLVCERRNKESEREGEMGGY
jgi:hypothetical protein